MSSAAYSFFLMRMVDVAQVFVKMTSIVDLQYCLGFREMATHANILAWRIPCSEEPGRLLSKGSKRVGHDWATSLAQVYSKVNQLYISIYLLFFRFFSHTGQNRLPSRVSCAIGQVLKSYLFYIQKCAMSVLISQFLNDVLRFRSKFFRLSLS